ncbi:MAG: thioredoxin-dependent thiol peroxidase [Pseudomonadota bacterium]
MSTTLAVGEQAPEFNLPVGEATSLSLSQLKGKNVVLYFYPKDDTPGCTKEAIAFTQAKAQFDAANTQVIGVSADSLKSHEKFAGKHDLAITLGADEEKQTIEAYGVWVEKNMYGRKYMGIERATYLIDAEGKIAEIWRKVKVPGHVDKVLAAAQGLSGGR